MQALLLLRGSSSAHGRRPARRRAPWSAVAPGEDQRMTGQGVGAARRRSRGHGPLTRQERHTLTERGQGLVFTPAPRGSNAAVRLPRPGARAGGVGQAARQFQRVIGDSQTPAPAPAGRPVVTKARNAPQAIKSGSAMAMSGPCRENAPTATQRAPAAGFCPDPPASTGRPSFLQTLLAAVDLPTSRPGAVSTETRLRRRPASGLRPICPGLSARRGPLAAGRPGLPGRAA